MNKYYASTTVRLTAEFRNSAGALADPTTVIFKMVPPGASATTYTWTGSNNQVVKDSTGVFHVDWQTAAVGIHEYAFNGDGAVDRAMVGKFEVLFSKAV